MKKHIFSMLLLCLAALPSMAQFYVEYTDGSYLTIDGNAVFSKDENTADYSVGSSYDAANSLSNVSSIFRMPSIFRVYSMYYGDDAPVYIHPYDHYRVDYDDPNVCNEYGNVADPDDPFWPGSRIVESTAGDIVYFLVDFDLGYDSPENHDNNPEGFITVSGLTPGMSYSGNEYSFEWSYRDDVGVWGWALEMPSEPVLIEAEAIELTTYEGEEFVGTYDCYYIHWGSQYASTIASTSQADATLELKASTLFTLVSETSRVPDYNYDNQGLYSYDNGTIAYDDDSCSDEAGRDKDGVGIQGTYNEEAWVMTALEVAQGGLDDTYRYFFTVKQSAGVTSFTAASNGSGNRFLIETETTNGKEYWYYNAPVGQKTLTKVYADFTGYSIAEDGAEAKVANEDGEILFKYACNDGTPVFTTIGSEAGTYTDRNGSNGNLVLDGFGEATFEGEQGTYVVGSTGMDITFTYAGNGETVSFIIYSDYTYSLQSGETDEIEGTFSTDNTYSYSMSVTIDPDAGTADFYFANDGNVYHDETGVQYVYDKSSKLLTVSGFTTGNAGSGGWGQVSASIEFSVSDDMTELTCLTEQLQHKTQGPSTVVDVEGTILSKQ